MFISFWHGLFEVVFSLFILCVEERSIALRQASFIITTDWCFLRLGVSFRYIDDSSINKSAGVEDIGIFL
jgi:vacuolar-type H+-ATPase subunit I/STV1